MCMSMCMSVCINGNVGGKGEKMVLPASSSALRRQAMTLQLGNAEPKLHPQTLIDLFLLHFSARWKTNKQTNLEAHLLLLCTEASINPLSASLCSKRNKSSLLVNQLNEPSHFGDRLIMQSTLRHWYANERALDFAYLFVCLRVHVCTYVWCYLWTFFF